MHVISLIVIQCFMYLGPTGAGYLLYSWSRAWGNNPECGVEEFLEWDKDGPCFTSTWDTEEKRRHLWCTCNRPGREIGTLLLYGIAQMTRDAEANNDCNDDNIRLVRQTLAEGHLTVPNIKVDTVDLPISSRTMISDLCLDI